MKCVCHVLFAKIMKKFHHIWHQQLLKHFTVAYRGFPPCTQSQLPINRETGYSNLGKNHGTISAVQMDFVQIAFQPPPLKQPDPLGLLFSPKIS